MSENINKICKLLEELIKATEAGQDVQKVEFDPDIYGNNRIRITLANGTADFVSLADTKGRAIVHAVINYYLSHTQPGQTRV